MSKFGFRKANTVDEAIQGAKDIIAERYSDDSDLRKELREFLQKSAFISSVLKKEKPKKADKKDIDNSDKYADKEGEEKAIFTQKRKREHPEEYLYLYPCSHRYSVSISIFLNI